MKNDYFKQRTDIYIERNFIMERTEKVELTALCLVYSEDAYLLQN